MTYGPINAKENFMNQILFFNENKGRIDIIRLSGGEDHQIKNF